MEIAAISIPLRPEPPETLNEEESAIWRKITLTKPPEWFEADTQPLLESYCKAITFQRRVVAELEQENTAGKSLTELDTLQKMVDRNAKLLASLATKMRLTPQSRYQPKSAATANNRAGAGSRPWQT